MHGLGSSDPGLCTNLDVAADAAGSNCMKRKEPELAPHSAEVLVSGIKVGDKLLAKGLASNGERTWFQAEVIGLRESIPPILVKYTTTMEGSDAASSLPWPRIAPVVKVDTQSGVDQKREAKRAAFHRLFAPRVAESTNDVAPQGSTPSVPLAPPGSGTDRPPMSGPSDAPPPSTRLAHCWVGSCALTAHLLSQAVGTPTMGCCTTTTTPGCQASRSLLKGSA